MTEDEHILLNEVGNQFYEDFSRLVAEALMKLPDNLRYDALDHLGDMTSVYGSNYGEYLPKE
jgi:hypothetical protein